MNANIPDNDVTIEYYDSDYPSRAEGSRRSFQFALRVV